MFFWQLAPVFILKQVFNLVKEKKHERKSDFWSHLLEAAAAWTVCRGLRSASLQRRLKMGWWSPVASAS